VGAAATGINDLKKPGFMLINSLSPNILGAVLGVRDRIGEIKGRVSYERFENDKLKKTLHGRHSGESLGRR
jgi:hypothetical protein